MNMHDKIHILKSNAFFINFFLKLNWDLINSNNISKKKNMTMIKPIIPVSEINWT